MMWKITVASVEPRMKVEWHDVTAKTKLKINGKEVKPGEEVVLTLQSDPLIDLSVIGLNTGGDGIGWVAVMLRNEYGKMIPLFVKQNLIKTGNIILGKINGRVLKDMYNLSVKYLETGTMELVGYVGHGDLVERLGFLPRYYVKVPGKKIKFLPIKDYIDLVDYLASLRGEITEFKGLMVALPPKIELWSISPLKLDEFGINVGIKDAGFNFIELYKMKDFNVRIFDEDWAVVREISDDSTEEVKE